MIFEGTPSEPARWHEFAGIFPMMEGAAYRELVEDVRRNGVIEPIIFLDGAILDGRNRYAAARELGIRYPRANYDGDDPLGYVISQNLRRRHLSESQRATVAAKLANMPHGGDRRSDQAANLPVVSQADAAAMLNVSERSVRSARTVVSDGAPELIAAVEAGDVSVSAAADVASLPKEEQAEVVARGEKEILAVAKSIRAGKAVARRAWNMEGRHWCEMAEARSAGFHIVLADNGSYVTESVAVPTEILLAAVRQAMIVSWGGATT